MLLSDAIDEAWRSCAWLPWVRVLPIRGLAKQVLDEYLEVFISEMALVLKELASQGQVLCHLEVLCLVEPSQRDWVDEATSRMFF